MIDILLEGANNIRDFGETETKDGKKIKPNIFIRSSALDAVTEKDIQILTEYYKLGTVIDLRTAGEKEEKPDVSIKAVKHLEYSLIPGILFGITHEEKTDRAIYASKLPDMRDLYRDLINNEHSQKEMRKVFDVLKNADCKKSILWHCASGKDRCGLVAALLLYMLNVDMETIFEDYIKSNIYVLKKAEKRYLETLEVVKDEKKAEVVRKVYSADKSYLKAAFDEIELKYGSIDNYINKVLGISNEEIQNLKSNCTY